MHQVSEIVELIGAIETLFARADKVSSIFTFSFMKGSVHKRCRKLGGGGVKFYRNRIKRLPKWGKGVSNDEKIVPTSFIDGP